MEKRRLGSLEVSVVGLGANNFGNNPHWHIKVSAVVCDQERTTRVVRAALDAGINLIDTADEYAIGQSEEFIGNALAGRRNEAIIASKIGSADSPEPGKGAGRERILRGVEGSLKRLKTDRIDLYQIHFPDPETPIEETLEALDRLVKAGKVREIGSCNYSGAQLDEALAVSKARGLARFVSAQNSWSLISRRVEGDVVPAAERHGMGMIPYWPLAGGVLTGKYRRGVTPEAGTRMSGQPEEARSKLLSDRTFDQVEALEGFAKARGHSLLELAFSWLASQPVTASIIAGATDPKQVEANARAASWRLTPDEMAELAKIRGGGAGKVAA